MYFPAFISSGQFCRFDMTVSYFISKRKYRADSEAIFERLASVGPTETKKDRNKNSTAKNYFT
jgi:hypothetical protein